MALIAVTTPQRETWEHGDRLRLLLGHENAIDLADPQVVASIEAHADDEQPRTIEHEHIAVDVACIMPVALKLADSIGNISDLFESLVQIDDHPRSARNESVEPTEMIGEAKLAWEPSPHVESA